MQHLYTKYNFLIVLFRNMSLLVRISVFWVLDQDTDLHALLLGLGRLLNLDIETKRYCTIQEAN